MFVHFLLWIISCSDVFCKLIVLLLLDVIYIFFWINLIIDAAISSTWTTFIACYSRRGISKLQMSRNKTVYDIFVNFNWVATRWQLYSTHLQTNNTQNDTKQTIYRTTHKFLEQPNDFGRLRAVPRLGELCPGICLTAEEKARKNLSLGSRTIRIHKTSNKNT
jgi:hypothetical protein